ncbi:hypothetical protein [Stieleria varia]|nr:hypothetical protein [Stieleria varia]
MVTRARSAGQFRRFMPIQVTCRNCLKRFQVSDKFAGKTGPCPSCKKPIQIPDKNEEVVIHAPPDDSPKDKSGQSVLKPIMRKETDVTRRGLIITVAAVLLTFIVAAAFRFSAEGSAPFWAQLLGLFLLAPPLVWAGYTFLYDQEREPYVGPELRNRVLICSGLLVLTWIVYAFVPAYLLDLEHANEMSYTFFGITLCGMIALGGLASAGCFELDYFIGVIHAGVYFVGIWLLSAASNVALAGVPLTQP